VCCRQIGRCRPGQLRCFSVAVYSRGRRIKQKQAPASQAQWKTRWRPSNWSYSRFCGVVAERGAIRTISETIKPQGGAFMICFSASMGIPRSESHDHTYFWGEAFHYLARLTLAILIQVHHTHSVCFNQDSPSWQLTLQTSMLTNNHRMS